MFHPSGQAGCLVVQEDAAILHHRFACRIASAYDREILLRDNRHIGPVVPRRDPDLFRQLVYAVYRSALVATGYDQCFVHSFQRRGYDRHQILLVLAFQLRSVYLLCLGQFLDVAALEGSHYHHAPGTGSRLQVGRLTGDPLEVFAKVPCRNLYTGIFLLVHQYGIGRAAFQKRKAIGRKTTECYSFIVDGFRFQEAYRQQQY